MKYELDPFHRDIPDVSRRRPWRSASVHRLLRLTKLTLSGLNRNISDGDLFVNLVEVWTAVGRQPTDHTCSHTPAESLASGAASATVPLAETS